MFLSVSSTKPNKKILIAFILFFVMIKSKPRYIMNYGPPTPPLTEAIPSPLLDALIATHPWTVSAYQLTGATTYGKLLYVYDDCTLDLVLILQGTILFYTARENTPPDAGDTELPAETWARITGLAETLPGTPYTTVQKIHVHDIRGGVLYVTFYRS